MTALIAKYDIYAAVLLVLFAAIIVYVIYYYVKNPVKKAEKVSDNIIPEGNAQNVDEEDTDGEPDIVEIHGTVSRKECFSAMNNSARNAHAYKTFIVYFKSDEGKEHEYSIDEETYLSIEEGEAGTVAIVGSRFYGFCADGIAQEEESSEKAQDI